jgi:hypothetical protein
MAFFTYKFVRAGEELCWNYSYEVRMTKPCPSPPPPPPAGNLVG